MLKSKKVVFDLKYTRLGDSMAFTSLPRLLKEQLDCDFYLSKQCENRFTNKDVFNLCFGMNPYFKGFCEDLDPLEYAGFDPRRIFFPMSASILETLENQFGLIGKGLPEIFYKPNVITELSDTVIVDKNWMTGKETGLSVDMKLFDRETQGEKNLLTVDPSKQDICRYADMIYSCKKFICMFSGSHALAVALRKPCIVIMPENLEGGGITKFIYRKSDASYIRNKTLKKYML